MTRNPLLPIIALALLPAGGGCVAVVAAGAAYGYVKYEKNEAYQDFETSVERAWTASIEALEASGYIVEPTVARSLTEDADSANVDGEGYWLRVEKHTAGLVRVRVRVGTFESEDHKRMSALLLESVGERL